MRRHRCRPCSLRRRHPPVEALASALPLHEEAWALAQQLRLSIAQVDEAINFVWWCTALPDGRARAIEVGAAALALGEFDGSDTLRNNLAWAPADAGRRDQALAQYRQRTRSADPSPACNAWTRIATMRGDAGEQGPELQQALATMERTDCNVVQADAMLALLRHGGDARVAAARRWLCSDQPLDPWLQQRLDVAPAERAPR